MCLERKHVDYLSQTNETDFQEGKISYETYVRLDDITERCLECELCGNGVQGDILGECRTRVLRLFISMKRDAETRLKANASRPHAVMGATSQPPDAGSQAVAPSAITQAVAPSAVTQAVAPSVVTQAEAASAGVAGGAASVHRPVVAASVDLPVSPVPVGSASADKQVANG